MRQHHSGHFIRGILGLAVAVLLPLSFYLIAKGLKKDVLNMPKKYRVDRMDTVLVDGRQQVRQIYHRVQEFSGINQLGDSVSLNKDLAGKVLVVHFFFASCPDVCPKTMNVLKLLQHAFRKDPKKAKSLEDDIQIVSISVDPAHDSVPILRAYGDRLGINHDRWWLLRTDMQQVTHYAHEELGLLASTEEGDVDAQLHSQKVVVLDQQRYIRGYYEGLDSVSIGHAANDISLITLEKKKER